MKTKTFKRNLKLESDNSDFSEDVSEFLKHSNLIEAEESEEALEDARIAWNFAFFNKDELIGIQYIKQIHYLLMKRIRPDIAGKFRHCDVFIGGKRKLFISEHLIESRLIEEICNKINKGNKNCKKVHIDFEDIHPFEDGNGRVGRILYNIHRLKSKLPIHIIHQGLEQFEYYEWFR